MAENALFQEAEVLIHGYRPQGECELSGRTAEAVEISTKDGSIKRAVISFRELTKLLRFRHRQREKQDGNGPLAAS